MSLPKYRPDIDGLRAVAVLAVVLHHLSAPLVPGGYVGVDVFFVISGYLITQIISREMEQGTFTFASFYERRARRIFPALFAVLGTTLAVGYFLLLPSDYMQTLQAALGTLAFASNVVFWRALQEGYFAATDAGLNPLLHTWSLAVEEQFYVFFPILLLLCFRYGRRHRPLVIAACAGLSLAAAAWLVESKSVAVFFLLPFRAWELLVGAVLALNVVPPIRNRVAQELAAGAGLLAILVACFAYDGKTTFPGLTALVPVLGAAALLHAGASGTTFAARLLQWRPLLYIGVISYSLYLWHWPLIVFVRYAFVMSPGEPNVVALLAASLAMGSLSYHFIEQPLRHGRFATRRFIAASSALCASVLLLVSGGSLLRGGNLGLYSPEAISLDKARAPIIPYKECNARTEDTWCTLGDPGQLPSVLLWGDSHLLSWGAALSGILERQGVRAIFVTNSACPPFIDVRSSARPNCEAQNLNIKEFIADNPSIRTILLAGFWSLYFSRKNELAATGGAPQLQGEGIAQAGLIRTIKWLHGINRQVILLGPVPVYKSSVPRALAIESATGKAFPLSSKNEQYALNTSFLQAVEQVQLERFASFRFLDPIAWLCVQQCMVTKEGVSLYRDADHLSVAGALSLQSELASGFKSGGQTVVKSEAIDLPQPKTVSY